MEKRYNKTCPVCGKRKNIAPSGREFKLQNVAAHIRHKAKSELFLREIFKVKKTPHLDYVKKHMKIVSHASIVLREAAE